MRLVHLQHIALQHGVVRVALHLDAVVGEHVAVVLDVLAELLSAAIFQPRLELRQHRLNGQLVGRIGIAVGERNVGRLAGRDAEAQAHDLGAHFVERRGFGVQRHQFSRLYFRQPRVEGFPGQDGVVLQRADRRRLCGRGKQIVGRRGCRSLGHAFHQALETELLVEGFQRGAVFRASGEGIERRQASHMVGQIAVCLDAEQFTPLGQPVQRLAEVFTSGALDVVGMRHHAVERAVFQQPFHGRLRAHFLHAGHVVHRVAHQGLVVHHQARRHTKFGLHTSQVTPLAVHRVDHGDVRVHQLAQVLVATGDGDVHALLRRSLRQRADHVVGLDAGHIEHLPAHQLHHFMDGWNLAAQIVRHRRAVGLVVGVQRVAEGWALGVKHAGGVIGRHVLAQLLQHVDHAADRPGGRALRVAGVGAQVGHGVEGAVQVAGAVNKQQGARRNGIGHFSGLLSGWWPV